MKDDKLYLLHISECMEKIERYTASGVEAFLADDKTRDAVIRNLQIMAESAKRVSDAVKSKHPDIEWRDLAAFRNVAVHDYLGIDWTIVWDIVSKDLPLLRPKINRLLQ